VLFNLPLEKLKRKKKKIDLMEGQMRIVVKFAMMVLVILAAVMSGTSAWTAPPCCKVIQKCCIPPGIDHVGGVLP
jgi:hypothetical protein